MSVKQLPLHSKLPGGGTHLKNKYGGRETDQTLDKYLRNAANTCSVSPGIGVEQSGDQGVTNMCGAKILLKQSPAD